jgi:signal transduction histidine kinase
MAMKRPFMSTLRARILSIVILAAILPLGLTGWWLSRSAATSAEQRLRAQLDSALAETASSAEDRWVFRDADLKLLANNEVVARLLSNNQRGASADDSAFLASLENKLRATISSVVLRDRSGVVRWAFGAANRAQDPTRGASQTEPVVEPQITITRTIMNSAGVPTGNMTVSVKLAALMPADSIPRLITGSLLRVLDNTSKQPIDGFGVENRAASQHWLVVRRPLTAVPVELELSAPAAAYLEPFERAARVGLLMLIAVTTLAIAFTAILTTRLTRSLDTLVDGADAVARGDLNRTVEVTGGTAEVNHLAASFNAMTESLRNTLDKLSQRESLAAVGEFAASLSHEVRNALTAVGVDVQRAKELIGDENKSRELLTRALRNVRRLDSIVTGSLRVAKSGHALRERVELVEILSVALQLAEHSMPSSIHVSIDDNQTGGITVVGDRVALEQLFLNILVNAGQAIEGSGRVDIALTEKNGYAHVLIKDNGRGMSASDLQRLDKPFYSANARGTGLGLSIARRIAASHGGDLTIESASGGGTTVNVTLQHALTASAQHIRSAV